MDCKIRKRLEYEEQFFGISSMIFSDCCEYCKVPGGQRSFFSHNLWFSCIRVMPSDLAHHFPNIRPLCFKKFVKDEVESKLKVLMKNLAKKLCDEAKNPGQFEIAMQKMMRDLSKEYMNILDRLFPEIDAKISSLVQIPSNVLLKEDLFVKSGTQGDINEIQQNIKVLEGTFTSLLYLREKLWEELQEVDSVENCFFLYKFLE